MLSLLFGDSPERANSRGIVARVPATAGRAAAPAVRARSLAVVDDTEAFRRPLGGYFRDRFRSLPRDARTACACCSFALSRSARPCMAAACSCTQTVERAGRADANCT